MPSASTRRPSAPGRPSALGDAHPAAVVAAVLALVMFGWHAWVLSRGYFWQDDFRYISRAATQPLGSYLFDGYGGHVMPGQFLLVWLVTATAPMRYTAAVLPVLALQVVGYVLAWRLLVRLFGNRWAILVPFAVLVCAPITFFTTQWWAYALQLMPFQVALLGALHAHVGYLRTGARRYGWYTLAWTVGGLFCWEKAALIPLVVFGLTVALTPVGGPLARLVIALRRHRRLWTGYLVLIGVYLMVFLSIAGDAAQSPVTAGAVSRLTGRMVFDTFLPGIVGGPWVVGDTTLAVPPGWVLAISWLLAAAVVGAGLWVGGRRAATAWLVLAGYLACCVLLVAATRLQLIGAAIGSDARYVADAVPVAAVLGALAFLRPRPVEVAGAPIAEPFPAPQPRYPAPFPPRLARQHTDRIRIGVVVGIVLLLVGSAVSTAALVPHGRHDAARRYVENVRNAALADNQLTLVDADVPDDVMIGLFLADRHASRVFAALPGGPRFDQPTEDLRILDATGVPRPVELADQVAAAAGPTDQCGYALRGEGSVIAPLPFPAAGGRQVVRLGYYTAKSVAGVLQAGDTVVPVRFAVGLHTLYAVVQGPFFGVELSVDPGGTVCVADIVVGAPRVPQ